MARSSTARKWLRFALDDLKIARAIVTMGPSFQRGAAYHSQQCVEKAIKAYLALNQKRFPKTHDISELIALVEQVDRLLAKKLSPSRRLTKYAIEYRYPDAASRPMTKAKASAAVKQAEAIFTQVSEIFSGGGQ